MHRCLTIDEILTIIFQHAFIILKPEPKSREFRDRRTLARLARTCRYFLEPALNVLYYEINDPLWLIKCMPDDLWVVNGKQLSFRRAMQQSDWDIFLRYARRVRSLEFDRQCISTTDVNVYVALAKPPSPIVIFPRLVHFRCGEYRPEAIPFLHHLLQPTVVHVDIDNLMANSLTFSLLPLLPSRCPRIKQIMAFRNFVFQRGDRALETFSKVLCQLTELQALRCAELPEESVLHLSQLPNLKILRMDLRLVSLDHLESAFSRTRFPVLREVLISAPSMFHSLRFLKFIQSTSVDTINLNVDDETCAADYNAIFTAWASNPSYRNLSVVDISEMQVWRDYDDKHIIDITTLRPLFQLKHITSLKLETLCTFDLDNAAIKEIAMAWPLLETLDLSIRECGWEIPSKVTLPGLLPLLQHCPNLALLGLVVDATVLPIASTRLPGAGVQNTSLESLWLADSKITRPSLVASFLSAVAPNIEQIVSWNTPLLSGRSGKDKYLKRWKEVERLVRQFTLVRRQERAWAGRWHREGCQDVLLKEVAEEAVQVYDSEPEPPTDSEDDDEFEYCYIADVF
ncbi:hypothetical protein EV363DRAFT_1337372 [Boletus edulis]|uniref:F-box domain-containing protein n=1 Tax=Boletus edulis BED1 TaxID=1328754 RepID=A0AAD4BPY6_BOLED|nr:hypothetical protein EV363DRAFT_1337372 [Boletus edulis]KAF8436559.1 hypothetical protein L210DRAFT_3407056 [Boletus edulis BED1]